MQGELHLAHVLSLSDRAKDSQNESIVEIREQLLAAAKAYLGTVERRLREGDLADVTVSITSSVAIEKDVAGTLIAMAENGKQMEDVETLPACDLISMATHGRGGLKRWILGSVTERVLGATRLPLLIVRPQQVDTPDEKADKNNGSELVEGEGTEVEAPAWVGLL
jgi:nucleotide-binding universal stress UspA family protein